MLDVAQAFVSALVGALATRTGQGVAGAASDAWSALVRTVRRKLRGDPGSAATLAAVERAPQDEDGQRDLVEALRRALAEDRQFADQFQSLWQQAQVEIHAEGGLVVQAGRDAIVNYVSALDEPPVVPRQVPMSLGPFTDRVPELSTLDRCLTADRSAPATMVLVVGMPGVGKTTLTARGVALVGDRFPGGHVHVDIAKLTGRSGAGAAVSEAAACGLRALGVDERFIPSSLAEQTKLFRTRTADRPPMLVVLDGVTESAQVEPLIPSAPGSAVLVATEYKLAELVKDGARLVEVKPLPPGEAVSLLADMCGPERVAAEPAAAEAVARWCGGLPEALRVAGSRLVLNTTVTVGELAEELADEARRLETLSLPGWAATGVDGTVAAAFAVSYSRLPEPARKLYRMLGVIPVEESSLELVHAVAGMDRRATTAALEALIGASLLERAGRHRYRMHPLVRLHATREATAERRDVLDAVVRFYLPRVAWADIAVMGEDRLRIACFDPAASGVPDPFGGTPGRITALMALEAERASLLTVVRAASEAGLDEPVWQLAQALTALYLNHRHHVDWIETSRLGIEAARRRGRRDVEARLRSLVSRAYTDLDDLPAARAQVEAAMAIAAELDDLQLRASVWEFRGRYLERVDRAAAVEAYQKAIDLNVDAGQWRGVALVRYFLGCCVDALGRPDEAMALLQQARSWLRERDDRMALRCAYSIGLAHLHAGEYREAGRELHAAADAFGAQRLWHYEVAAREAVADLHQRLGDRDGERRALQRALHIEQAAGGLRVDRLRARLALLG